MKTVYFHNPGELDIRGATTMGLSAKDTDDAIGKFGTGLKYAIASILRWGGAVSIETGGEIYEFSVNPISFRGKAHDQIVMRKRGTGDCQELGYTTHYGSHWEPWQIFRELYSNAKDEGGGVSNQPFAVENEATLITVHCAQVADCYYERDTIILPYAGVQSSDDKDLHFIAAPSSFLYYRSVRVHKHDCLFTWNLTDGVTLTEDRSITNAWSYEGAVGNFIQNCSDYDICYKMLRADERYFESTVDYSLYQDTSEAFLNAAEAIWKQHGRRELPNGVWGILCKHRKHIDAPPVVELNAVQQKQLNRAVELVCRMGLHADNYPISVVAFDKNKLGEAKDGKVFLSPAVFEQGTKQVVSTLFEEVMHLETGLKDLTYEMQTYLFNRIVSLYEEHVFQEAC
jgi:hypothetical protein